MIVPSSAIHCDPPIPTPRQRALDWLFNQGVSTVLLFSILMLGVYVVRDILPRHLEMIQSGYERMQEQHDNGLRQALDSFAEQQELNRDLIRQLIDLL